MDSGTAALGWAPVRQVPSIFVRAVAEAETATMRWYNQRNATALDEAVSRWEWLCRHPQFTSFDLFFRLDVLNRCGIAYLDRGAHRLDGTDLEHAESCWGQALLLLEGRSPERSRFLHNLGSLASVRYKQTGLADLLANAIKLLEDTIADAVSTDHSLALYHHSLGIALTYRYERRGALADLDSAIKYGQIALELSPLDDPRRVDYLTQLGSRYRHRFIRTRSSGDIENAILLLEAAVDGAPQAKRPGCLCNLGNGLLDRYGLAGNRDDLERSIVVHRQAIDATPSDNPLLATRLNNLGNSLSRRCSLSNAVRDFEEAAEVYRQSIRLTPSTDPYLPTRLYNLANLLRDRSAWTNIPEDLNKAKEYYRESCITGLEYSVEWVLAAAKAWGEWAEQREEWKEADEAYGYGLQAMDTLYRSQLVISHKQSWLVEGRDLARRAAYIQGRLDRLTDAAVTLEQNRTRVLAEALNYQEAAIESVSVGDRNALLNARDKIARLEAEAREANHRTDRDVLRTWTDLRAARDELSSIIDCIRGYVPNYAPEGLDFAGIVALAEEMHRPLVYLVTTSHGSLALIVASVANATTPARVERVWINTFSVEILNQILHGTSEKSSYLEGIIQGETKVLQNALNDAWHVIEKELMQPIVEKLKELGFLQAVLIPTGTLALLPLHAVVLDTVSVSYIPSARSLHSALYDKDHVNLPPRLLGIGNPLSNGLLPLMSAQMEVEQILSIFSKKGFLGMILCDEKARRENIVSQLQGSTHLHFACHGQFDLYSPLDSALHFTGDEILSIRDLLEGHLDVSVTRLVVLSACQTGITEFQNMPDEAVGFPAGFIQAGVPRVISTLWPVDDLSTAALIRQFYLYHLEDGLELATALNLAQRWLRDATAADVDLVAYYQHLYFKSGRRDAKALECMRYYKANPDVKPFKHPYFWAGFMFSGV